MTLTGQTTLEEYGPFTAVSNQDGTYTVDFMFTVVDLYTLSLKLDSTTEILGSPVPDIILKASDVQAEYSALVQSLSTITAGDTHTWQI